MDADESGFDFRYLQRAKAMGELTRIHRPGSRRRGLNEGKNHLRKSASICGSCFVFILYSRPFAVNFPSA
jgi:hypothetical protein